MNMVAVNICNGRANFSKSIVDLWFFGNRSAVHTMRILTRVSMSISYSTMRCRLNILENYIIAEYRSGEGRECDAFVRQALQGKVTEFMYMLIIQISN